MAQLQCAKDWQAVTGPSLLGGVRNGIRPVFVLVPVLLLVLLLVLVLLLDFPLPFEDEDENEDEEVEDGENGD